MEEPTISKVVEGVSGQEYTQEHACHFLHVDHNHPLGPDCQHRVLLHHSDASELKMHLFFATQTQLWLSTHQIWLTRMSPSYQKKMKGHCLDTVEGMQSKSQMGLDMFTEQVFQGMFQVW